MNKDIQVLRFFAITFVILLHTTFIVPDGLRYIYTQYERVFHSNTGVELFFVIAGYFTMQSLSKIDDNLPVKNRAYIAFALVIKKLKRLSPSVYLWAAIPLIISVLTNNHSLWLEPSVMLQKFLATVTYMTNFEISGKKSYFEYFWAVSLEVQFFILFPTIYFLAGKRLSLIISAALAVLMAFFRPGGEFSWWFRFDGLLIGALCYYFVNDLIGQDNLKNLLKSKKGHKLLVAALCLIALAATYNTLVFFPNFKSTAASIISFALVLMAVSQNNYFTMLPAYLTTIMVGIGNRSFALFCCHVPVWIGVRQLYESLNIQHGHLFTVQILMMFIFAEITYRFIEKR